MRSKVAVLTLAVSLSVAPALLASKDTQSALQKEAKISMTRAREIALKKAPGKIESGELEREHGKLIYSFDIRQPGKSGITEVAVDAMNGKIIDVHHETPAKEAAEKKQEAKEKKKQ
jgi:hypothetical protein